MQGKRKCAQGNQLQAEPSHTSSRGFSASEHSFQLPTECSKQQVQENLQEHRAQLQQAQPLLRLSRERSFVDPAILTVWSSTGRARVSDAKLWPLQPQAAAAVSEHPLGDRTGRGVGVCQVPLASQHQGCPRSTGSGTLTSLYHDAAAQQVTVENRLRPDGASSSHEAELSQPSVAARPSDHWHRPTGNSTHQLGQHLSDLTAYADRQHHVHMHLQPAAAFTITPEATVNASADQPPAQHIANASGHIAAALSVLSLSSTAPSAQHSQAASLHMSGLPHAAHSRDQLHDSQADDTCIHEPPSAASSKQPSQGLSDSSVTDELGRVRASGSTHSSNPVHELGKRTVVPHGQGLNPHHMSTCGLDVNNLTESCATNHHRVKWQRHSMTGWIGMRPGLSASSVFEQPQTSVETSQQEESLWQAEPVRHVQVLTGRMTCLHR